jgi:hypothetical protein
MPLPQHLRFDSCDSRVWNRIEFAGRIATCPPNHCWLTISGQSPLVQLVHVLLYIYNDSTGRLRAAHSATPQLLSSILSEKSIPYQTEMPLLKPKLAPFCPKKFPPPTRNPTSPHSSMRQNTTILARNKKSGTKLPCLTKFPQPSSTNCPISLPTHYANRTLKLGHHFLSHPMDRPARRGIS